MKPGFIQAVEALCAKPTDGDKMDKGDFERFLEQYSPPNVLLLLGQLIQQADGDKNIVRLPTEEECFQETFGQLEEDIKISLERLFALGGRFVHFSEKNLNVHPLDAIKRNIESANDYQSFQLTRRRKCLFGSLEVA